MEGKIAHKYPDKECMAIKMVPHHDPRVYANPFDPWCFYHVGGEFGCVWQWVGYLQFSMDLGVLYFQSDPFSLFILLRLWEHHFSYWYLAGNGWEWGNGMIIDNYCGSFPHSLLSTSKFFLIKHRHCASSPWRSSSGNQTWLENHEALVFSHSNLQFVEIFLIETSNLSMIFPFPESQLLILELSLSKGRAAACHQEPAVWDPKSRSCWLVRSYTTWMFGNYELSHGKAFSSMMRSDRGIFMYFWWWWRNNVSKNITWETLNSWIDFNWYCTNRQTLEYNPKHDPIWRRLYQW